MIMGQEVTKQLKDEVLYLCNTCKTYKPKDHFSIDRTNLHNNRNGLCRSCKQCQRKHYYAERERLVDDRKALTYKLRQAFKGTRRRSKVKGTYTDLTFDYLRYLWEKQNGLCALTGIPMTYEFYNGRTNTNLSVDRIDSNKGYVKDNVQLVCMMVNQMKNDLSYEELIDLCSKVLTYSTYAMQREKLKAQTALKNKVVGEKSIPKVSK